MKQLVIFDLDGTLLNTIADLAAATNYALECLHYPTHTPIAYNAMVGNGITRLIERALPEDARSSSIIENARTHFLHYYDEHCTDKTAIYPGIPQLLAELRDRGVKLAVASNKYQKAVTKLIEHFFGDISWSAVMGHIDGVPTKPDPSIVFEVLQHCPTSKSEVLYVGDSGIDMETARRACVESVGVTWGYRPRHDLVANYADHIVSNPDDILPFI